MWIQQRKCFFSASISVENIFFSQNIFLTGSLLLHPPRYSPPLHPSNSVAFFSVFFRKEKGKWKTKKCRIKKINEQKKKTKRKALEIHIYVETPTFAKHRTHKKCKIRNYIIQEKDHQSFF